MYEACRINSPTFTIERKILNDIDQELLENTDLTLPNILLFGVSYFDRAPSTQILKGSIVYIGLLLDRAFRRAPHLLKNRRPVIISTLKIRSLNANERLEKLCIFAWKYDIT